MWCNIFLYFCIYYAIAKVNCGLNSIPVYMDYCVVYTMIFNQPCPISDSNDPSSDGACKLTLKEKSLQFECNNPFTYLSTFEGACNVDEEVLRAYNCLAQKQGYIQKTLQCKTLLKYNKILKNCNNSHVYTISISAFKPTDIYTTPKVPNLKQLNWRMHGKCYHINDFLKRFKFLERISIKILDSWRFNNCGELNLANNTHIKEVHLHMSAPLSILRVDVNLDKFFFSRDLLRGMTNLQLFELKGVGYDHGVNFDLHTDMFEGLTNLTTIEFNTFGLFDLTAKPFEDLIGLRSLSFNEIRLQQFHWLSSQTLQQNLEYLEMKYTISEIEDLSGIQYLENYTKLGLFDLSSNTSNFDWVYKYNMFAFICTQRSRSCIFKKDINSKPCPYGCVCTLERPEMRFKIDCDSIEARNLVPDLPIPVTGNASLYFNNKGLTELPNSTLYGYYNLRELHVANNSLTYLNLGQLPPNLTYLDIGNNSLRSLNWEVMEFLSNRSGTIRLRLSNNPWICNCEAAALISFVANLSNKIEDRESIECDQRNPGLMMYLSKGDICESPTTYVIIALGSLVFVAIIIIAYFSVKQSIIIYLYEHNLCVSCISRPEPENSNNLHIDAFLAFSHQDLEHVEEFIEKLERGSREFQLCFYQRDWLVGESIPACILKSIEESKRIIILMTKNFAQSSWGRFEFRMAIQATSNDQYKRLIIVVYPEVENFNDLDSELRTYMKFNTYLRRDDPQFWRKLIYAMPHNYAGNGRVNNSVCKQVEDRLLQ